MTMRERSPWLSSWIRPWLRTPDRSPTSAASYPAPAEHDLEGDLDRARQQLAGQDRALAELRRREQALADRVAFLEAERQRLLEAANGRRSDLARVRQELGPLLDHVGIVADSVGQLVGTSEAADALLVEGRAMLKEALAAMAAVRASIQDSLQLVESFGQRSRQIEEVLKDIADIAYFTRMLSLNAAIEAARAGQQGKSFGFLADEVQNLAQTISQSTSDIRELLESVAKESGATALSVQRSADEVAQASQGVARLDGALGRIMEELHSMDADLQDSHLMSLRIASQREQAIVQLSALETANS